MRVRLLALLLGALLVAGCGSDDEREAEPAASASPTPSATASEAPAAGCEEAEAPEAKKPKLDKPGQALDPAKTYTATVRTSCGDFEIELDVERAPKTATSFAHMAREGAYDDTTFYRISPGFVIQGGDPTQTGAGDAGYQIEEAPPSDLRYEVGTVAMAKTQTEAPGTSGSTFFVVTGEGGLNLPPDYALVGTVSGGEDAVGSIATTPSDPATEQPQDPIVIESVTVAES